jgi:hypothetical protein
LAHSLHLKRELRYGWAQVGDNLEERFTLVNDFILPATWVVIHDHSTLPDHHASVAIGVDSRNKTQWKLLNQCTQRGVFTLGGTTIESGDPFGLYTQCLTHPRNGSGGPAKIDPLENHRPQRIFPCAPA